MNRPPRTPGEGLIAGGMAWQIVWVGMLMAAFALHTGNDHWQTMVFTVLTLTQMCQIMAIRSDRDPLVGQGVSSNMPLLGAVMLTTVLQLAVIYLPQFNSIFNTTPLTALELLACVALSSTAFVAVEINKWIVRARTRS